MLEWKLKILQLEKMNKFGTNTLHDTNTHTHFSCLNFSPFSAFLTSSYPSVTYSEGSFPVCPDGTQQVCFACCTSYWNRVLQLVYAGLTSRGLQTSPKREALDGIKTLEIFST